MKRLLTLIVGLSLLAGSAIALDLNGAGATFPAPIYSKWFSLYEKETGVKVNYQAIGSGGGIRQFTAGVVDFGASDAFMTNKEIAAAGGDVLHIPTVMGSVALAYNLKGVSSLKLTPEILAGIYLGDIKKWNDPKIAAINEGTLPDKNITVVYRSDGSGTTSIFTTYMTKISAKWAANVGADKAVSWPVGVGGKGNFGVAGIIQQVDGAIGYVELAYAMENKISFASLQNKSGKFVDPSIDSTSAAAQSGLKKIPSDFRVDMTNMPGKKSYPIVGMTWLLVHQNMKGEKAEAIKNLLNWCMNKGEAYAAALYYAPLPPELISQVKEKIATID